MKKLKQIFRVFNIFDLNLDSRSYKSPMIRIAVSLLILLAVLAFRLNVTITDLTVNILLTVLLAIMVMCILCFFIAAVECLQVGDNRKKDKAREKDKNQ